jgi:ABC-type sugar transport system ATPase subunit
MAGRRLEQLYPARRTGHGPALLTVSGLSRTGEFTDISFELHAGEIVGLFGLVGSGRSELAACIFGARPATAGRVRVDGGAGDFRTTGAAIAAGLALVTEDRARSGLVMGMSVSDNITLTTWRSTARGPLIDTVRLRRDVSGMVQRLGIRPAGSASMPVVNLSGGNQQKVVLAKWLLLGPRLLLLDEPTRGVDMATRVELYHLIDGLARDGIGALLISSDLTEVLGATDRVLVMNQGRITGERVSEQTTEDEILADAIGRPA